jgi:uncharacterized protein YndB with AHSA1/START domain
MELGLDGMEGLVSYREVVSDFGDVDVWLHDVVPAYDRASKSHDITLSEDETVFSLEGDLPMSPSVVWAYLSDPAFRSLLIGSDRQEVTDRSGGRIGVGTAYQCYHGRQVLPQTILQWEPFTKIVTQDVMPKPMNGTAITVVGLEEIDDGTHITRTLGRMDAGPVVRLAGRFGFHRMIRGLASRGLDTFSQAIIADWEKREAAATPATHVTQESIGSAARVGLEAVADAEE